MMRALGIQVLARTLLDLAVSESTGIGIVIFTDSLRSIGPFSLRSDYTKLKERANHVQYTSIAQEILPNEDEPLLMPFSVA